MGSKVRDSRVWLLLLLLPLSNVGCGTFGGYSPGDFPIRLVRDGVYTGTEKTIPITATVRVAIASGRIDSIVVLQHFSHPDHSAAAVADRIVERQSLLVDAISGATLSSGVVVRAVMDALEKGL